MRSRAEDRIPVNITLFSPKILGLDAKNAVLLILVISSASLISRISLPLSVLIVIAGIFLIFPVRKGDTLAGILSKTVGWKFASKEAQIGKGLKIRIHNETPLLEDGKRIGVCLEVSGDPFHTLSRQDREDSLKGISRALGTTASNLTFLAFPVELKSEHYHTEGEDRFAENYNLFMDFILDGQFFYRSFIVVWEDSKGDFDKTVEHLVESAKSLGDAITFSATSCRVLSSREELENILGALI